MAVVETARELNYTYEDFSNTMQTIQKYKAGSNMETVLRKIYAKYIYKGSKNTDTVDVLYSNVIELINNSNSIYDLQEVESIIEDLYSKGKINNKEYNYLINLVNEKRSEF